MSPPFIRSLALLIGLLMGAVLTSQSAVYGLGFIE